MFSMPARRFEMAELRREYKLRKQREQAEADADDDDEARGRRRDGGRPTEGRAKPLTQKERRAARRSLLPDRMLA